MPRTLVIATTNQNKVNRIKSLLTGYDLDIKSLKDYAICSEPEESLETPEAIASQKALFYVSKLPVGTLVLTQDDTLKMFGVEEADNPKMSIKKPVVDQFGEFTDENAAKYYSELAKKYGGTINIIFQYGHSLAMREEDDRKTITLFASSSELEASLIDEVYKLETVPGYFLAALMKVNIDDKNIYYNDLSSQQLIDLDIDLKKSIQHLLSLMGINNEK